MYTQKRKTELLRYLPKSEIISIQSKLLEKNLSCNIPSTYKIRGMRKVYIVQWAVKYLQWNRHDWQVKMQNIFSDVVIYP